MNAALRLAAITAFSLVSIGQTDAAENWPTWRGSSGAGLAPGATPPLKWSDTKNIKWKTKVPGYGFSTPIIWENQVFLLSAFEVAASPGQLPAPAITESAPPPQGKAGARGGDRRGKGGFGGGTAPTKPWEFVVIALDRSTGKILWQKTARRETPHEGHHASHGYASASPVTDGERLYASFGSRGLFCYDLQGNLQWEKDLGDMRTRGGFGEGASPALAGDLLLVNWDHEDQSFIVALNRKTGAEVWRKNREERSSWSTPLVVEINGRLQAIVSATTRTRSYDTLTGEVIWEAGGMTANVIPTPVVGHGNVYLMSGFQGRSIQAVKLSSRGDVTDTKDVVWSVRHSAPYVPSPVLSGDRLYLSKSNDAFLACLNAHTGESYYQDQPLEGMRGIYASPLAANGYVYVVGREGMVMVLKDAPTFEVVATNILSDKLDASPVMLGKELFLRGHEFIYCISES